MTTVWSSFLSGLIPVLVICLCFGLGFAYIALLTVRAAEKALTLANQSTTFEVGNIKVTTGSALVALYIIAAVFGLGIPVYWIYLDSHRDDPVFVETRLDPSPASLTIISKDYGDTAISRFPIYRSRTRQHLVISIKKFNPVNVVGYYNWSENGLDVSIGERQYRLHVDGSTATLDEPIKLQLAQIPAQTVAKNVKLTRSVGVTPEERKAADPPGVRP